MQRYNKITQKIPREILLLKSLPCIYGKCSFCNYILDNSQNTDEIAATNATLIKAITGEFGIVEIINSGSVFELPISTLEAIRQQVSTRSVHTLYFEAYYGYRKRLQEMRDFFSQQNIRYRIGIETFDDDFRKKILNKPFSTANLTELAEEFYACCLLICIKGQTKAQILEDIECARHYFREITINVFVDNGTAVSRDPALVSWFVQYIYPHIKDEQHIEILIDNKDLGVYVQ